MSRQPAPASPPEPAPASARPAEAPAAGGWAVFRQDDNGNRFSVDGGMTREEAERRCRELEARGHKQIYWVGPDGPDAG